MVMLGASYLRQQRRLWTVLGRPEMIKRSNEERDANHEREVAALTEIMLTCSAEEWEEFLQGVMCRRRGCARWPMLWPIRSLRAAASFIAIRQPRALRVHYWCPLRHLPMRMEAHASTRRHLFLDSTMTRFSLNSA
jgi:crotonobetainyl-CoA:carnitine CoA-transferase CaiB-like acyl-CoA transferase